MRRQCASGMSRQAAAGAARGPIAARPGPRPPPPPVLKPPGGASRPVAPSSVPAPGAGQTLPVSVARAAIPPRPAPVGGAPFEAGNFDVDMFGNGTPPRPKLPPPPVLSTPKKPMAKLPSPWRAPPAVPGVDADIEPVLDDSAWAQINAAEEAVRTEQGDAVDERRRARLIQILMTTCSVIVGASR